MTKSIITNNFIQFEQNERQNNVNDSYLDYRYIREIPENPTEKIPTTFTASIYAHQISPKTRLLLRDIPIEGNEKEYPELLKIEAFNACSSAVLKEVYNVSYKKIITGEACYDKNKNLIANVYSPFCEYGIVALVYGYYELCNLLKEMKTTDVFITCGRTEDGKMVLATYSPNAQQRQKLNSLLQKKFGMNYVFVSNKELNVIGSLLHRVHT